MLSKSSKYALRAVLCLAVNSDENKKMSPKTIAEKIDIPVPYLASILQQLSRNEIISSTKGRNGGFYITQENAETPLLKIIECIDGLNTFTECMIGLPNCSDESPCPIHHLFSAIRTNALKELKDKSIKDFSKDIIDGNTVLF